MDDQAELNLMMAMTIEDYLDRFPCTCPEDAQVCRCDEAPDQRSDP